MRIAKKIWKFLDARNRRQAILVLALIILSAACEGISIGFVFPLAKLAVDGSSATRPGLVQDLAAFLPATSPSSLLLWFAAGFVTVIVAKNVVLLVSTAMQARLVRNAEVAAGQVLMSSYLQRPYLFHLEQNSAVLIRNLNEVMPAIFAGIMMPVLRLVAELFIVVVIAAVLITIDPVVTLIMLAGGTALVASIFGLLKSPLKRWGKHRLALSAERLKCLQQTLGSIKEVKVLGREHYFLNVYSGILEMLTRLNARLVVIGDFRRAAAEIATVIALAALILLAVVQKREAGELLAFVGVFAAAAFRLMPSANRILIALESVRAALPALEIASAHFPGFEKATSAPSRRKEASASRGVDIVCSNLSFTYPRAAHPTLDAINLTIRRGNAVGIVGPSGAGKTTLIDLLLGLLSPSTGDILVGGKSIRKDMSDWQRRLGYVPQSVHLNDDSVRRNVAFGIPDAEIDDTRLASALRLAQLTDLVDGLPQGQHTIVGERGARLSGGQRQRIGIARALYHDPEVLIFDEATSALDNETERSVTAAIERLHGEKTIIIIAHRLSTVRQCDYLVYLDGGRIAATGSFDELRENHPNFRRMVELSRLDLEDHSEQAGASLKP